MPRVHVTIMESPIVPMFGELHPYYLALIFNRVSNGDDQ